MIIHTYNFVKRFAQNNKIFPNFVVFKIRFYGQKIFLYLRAVSISDTARPVLSRRIKINIMSFRAERQKRCTSCSYSCLPLGGKGDRLGGGWGEFYFLFCEKGKTVFRIRFPFLTLFPFPKTPHNPHKVIPYSLFQSPLIFKGQRSLVAERI